MGRINRISRRDELFDPGNVRRAGNVIFFPAHGCSQNHLSILLHFLEVPTYWNAFYHLRKTNTQNISLSIHRVESGFAQIHNYM